MAIAHVAGEVVVVIVAVAVVDDVTAGLLALVLETVAPDSGAVAAIVYTYISVILSLS